MALMAKLVAISWPLVTYRVLSVNCLITEVIPRGPEHACVWIYIPVFYQKLSKLTEEMPSELHLSHLGNAFESPRNHVWVTLNAELIAITWPLGTYRVPLVKCLIVQVIPLGSYQLGIKFDSTSELRLSHLGITFASPRRYVWITLNAE